MFDTQHKMATLDTKEEGRRKVLKTYNLLHNFQNKIVTGLGISETIN